MIDYLYGSVSFFGDFVLKGNATIPIGQISLIEVLKNAFFEDFSHVFRSDVKTFLYIWAFEAFFLHLIVIFADIVQGNFVLIVYAVLANLPESNGCDCVDSYVKLSSLDNTITHLDHGFFFLVTNLAFPANTDNHVPRLHDRHEVDFELEYIVHFLNELFPILKREAYHFWNIELFKVVFLLETGRIDGVGSHILNR